MQQLERKTKNKYDWVGMIIPEELCQQVGFEHAC